MGNSMKILTFVKHVPTSAATPRIAEAGDRIEESGLQYEANEADIYAIEEAVHQKGEAGGGEIIAATIGPDRAKEALHLAYAKGVDKVIHVMDPVSGGNDAGVNRSAAEAVANKVGPDLILCGVQAEDDLQGEFGISLGPALEIPVITAVTEINLDTDQKTATVVREIGAGFKEEIEVDLPCVLTIQYGIRQLRYTPIMQLVRMRKKPIETLDLADLGVAATGTRGGMRVVRLAYPEAGGHCQVLDGAPGEATDKLVRQLAEIGVLKDAG